MLFPQDLSFVIQAKVFDKSFKGAKCVSITIVSSKINETIKTILNFFIQKFHERKKHKTFTSENRSKIVTYSLICVFALLPGCICAF